MSSTYILLRLRTKLYYIISTLAIMIEAAHCLALIDLIINNWIAINSNTLLVVTATSIYIDTYTIGIILLWIILYSVTKLASNKVAPRKWIWSPPWRSNARWEIAGSIPALRLLRIYKLSQVWSGGRHRPWLVSLPCHQQRRTGKRFPLQCNVASAAVYKVFAIFHRNFL